MKRDPTVLPTASARQAEEREYRIEAHDNPHIGTDIDVYRLELQEPEPACF
jgi:hypothetical protein